jgi:hypothetical protein
MALGPRKLMRLGYRLFSVTLIVKIGPLGFLLLHLVVRLFRWIWRLWTRPTQKTGPTTNQVQLDVLVPPSVRS